MSNPIRTLVVDDSEDARRVICRLLEVRPNIEIVGTASNGREALQKVAALEPDLVLMDLQMPEMDGREATQRLRQMFPRVRVIALTIDDTAQTRIACQASGAHGFASKLRIHQELYDEIARLFPDVLDKA